ncbi:hypothetical protein ES711_10715 [Gelidibacter salicanalis]|uniref:Uncharacterized protein n=1 Tax=Gelidibacter salicanalis TaxID=291193 RepID=A0A5C7AIT2_9FLAO|nr:hypothetical protein [Gelidibacter salicanalis]TXE07894.1 hypothetical protein ES711_10715 [Gelidibacter salicanalis]
MTKPKKILKIIAGIIIFLTLPSLLLFGFVYFKYNEDVPTGTKGQQAEQLATKMLHALDHDAYKNTNYLEWTFKKRHHFKWNKAENTCEVYWKDYKVTLDLNSPSNSKVFQNEQIIEGKEGQELIDKALSYFNNDSFWVVAPYKVFDAGTERQVVTLDNGSKALLVTYNSGGTTPGDSYLWHLEDTGKPNSFQMWVDILPIGGLEASWSDWTTTDSGAHLPTFHKFLVFGIEITDVVGKK